MSCTLSCDHSTRENAMARGSKKSYSSKQKRTASHIEKSAKRSGKSAVRAKQIAWATVNKQDHGGKKSGSGRGKKSSHASSRKGGRRSHRAK
ncbi:MAG: plasmid stabilization protein [bacterium]